MKHLTLTSALALMALSLGACERGGMVNSQICTPFKDAAANSPTPAVNGAVDAASPVDDCVRRWAYSLAGSRDSADVVAGAAVAACGASLSRWNQAGLNAPAGQGDQAISLTTGEPTNAMAEHNAFAQSRALLYVVQARAGHCAPPPATNGVPNGV